VSSAESILKSPCAPSQAKSSADCGSCLRHLMISKNSERPALPDSPRARLEMVMVHLNTLTRRIASLEDDNEELRSSRDALQKENETLLIAAQDAQKANAELALRIQTMQEQCVSLQSIVDEANATIQLLRAGEEDFQASSQGLRKEVCKNDLEPSTLKSYLTKGGVAGSVGGGAIGTTTGAVIGIPAAAFTFGMSVPIGAAVGCAVGTVSGGTAGIVLGSGLSVGMRSLHNGWKGFKAAFVGPHGNALEDGAIEGECMEIVNMFDDYSENYDPSASPKSMEINRAALIKQGQDLLSATSQTLCGA